MNDVKITDFFQTNYCNYGSYDNFRKIANIVDGCKVSARKCLHIILKDNIKINGKFGNYLVNIKTGLVFMEGKGNLLIKSIYSNNKPLLLDFMDEDPMTADIMSKAIVLANDYNIKESLHAVFSRSGFTKGYFEGKLGKEMFGIRQKEDVEKAFGKVKFLSNDKANANEIAFITDPMKEKAFDNLISLVNGEVLSKIRVLDI